MFDGKKGMPAVWTDLYSPSMHLISSSYPWRNQEPMTQENGPLVYFNEFYKLLLLEFFFFNFSSLCLPQESMK